MVRRCCRGCCCGPPDPDAEGLLSSHDGKSDTQDADTRRCTDCLCLLLFALTLAAAGTVAQAAFIVGDPERLTNGVDYTGALCGRGALSTQPYVYYPMLHEDLQAHREILMSAPWAIPLYGICVAACPQHGDDVVDYACQRGHHSCGWHADPLLGWYTQRRNMWHVNADTSSMLNRCLPTLRETSSELVLCAYPTCDAMNRTCYGKQFADARSWRPAASEMAACEEVVTIKTLRTVAAKGSAIELEYIGGYFGGVLGFVTNIYLGSLEGARTPCNPSLLAAAWCTFDFPLTSHTRATATRIAAPTALCRSGAADIPCGTVVWAVAVCGVLVAVVANFAIMFLLRLCVKIFFYATLLCLLLTLVLVDVVAFAKAGALPMPQVVLLQPSACTGQDERSVHGADAPRSVVLRRSLHRWQWAAPIISVLRGSRSSQRPPLR